MRNDTARIVVCAFYCLFCLIPIAAAQTLTIYTVNHPLKYFAERIAGEHADVFFPAPPDVDPAFWMPDIETIIQYQRADLILLNGADYAKWIGKVSLPRSKLVDTSRDFKDFYLTVTDVSTHSHGREGDHSHIGTFFTTWLDFSQAAKHAKAITQALVAKRPEQSVDFQANYSALERDLLTMDQEIKAMVAAAPTRPLLASHPIYQYLARRYELDIRSVLWEPGEVPNEGQWMKLQQVLTDHAAKTMIWESRPHQVTLDRLNSLGIQSLVFDPCANTCEGGDFLSVMQDNVERLSEVFR